VSRDGFLARLAPGRLGPQVEHWIAAAICAAAITFTFNNALARRAPDVPREDSTTEGWARLQHDPWALRVFLAWALLGVAATFVVQTKLAKKILATPPGESPWPAAHTGPPPFGLADFGIVFVASIVFQILAGFAVLPPTLVLEDGSSVTLYRPASFGRASVAPDTTMTTIAVPGATAERARVARKGDRVVLTAPPALATEPPLFLNGRSFDGGEHVLTPADNLNVGRVQARLEEDSLAHYFGAVIASQLATLAVLVLVLRARGTTLADVGLRREGALREALRGVAGYLASVPLVLAAIYASSVLCRVLDVANAEHPLLKKLERDPQPGSIALVVLAAAVIAPVCEELLFRAVLQRALVRTFPARVTAVLVASFFFASVHPGLASLLPILVVGSVFGALYATSPRGSLVGSIVAHMLFNGVNIAFAVLPGRA
jgi:membrane protease YdiL (CAAX protease family)